MPRVLALEVTRRCNLECIHCRAVSGEDAPEGELTLADYEALFDNIASFASPLILLTGGEPLLRDDIYDLAAAASARGFRAALSTNGTLVTREVAARFIESGVKSASISIDGASARVHDDFRRQPGAFVASLRGMEIFRKAGFRVQVNTSLTRRNMHDLENIFAWVKRSGAPAWHVFLLVPTGRGEAAASRELIDTEDYEHILGYLYEKDRDEAMEIKPTCAPQYYRILRERAGADGIDVEPGRFGLNARTRGCLAGVGFGFVSYRGEVFPCGYYPELAGHLREFTFREIWEESPLFAKLRNYKEYKGRCGRCRYIRVCGGCRARARAITGDDMASEPFCGFGGEME